MVNVFRRTAEFEFPLHVADIKADFDIIVKPRSLTVTPLEKENTRRHNVMGFLEIFINFMGNP